MGVVHTSRLRIEKHEGPHRTAHLEGFGERNGDGETGTFVNLGRRNRDIRQSCGDLHGLRKSWAAVGSVRRPISHRTPAPSPGMMKCRAAPKKSAGPQSPFPPGDS